MSQTIDAQLDTRFENVTSQVRRRLRATLSAVALGCIAVLAIGQPACASTVHLRGGGTERFGARIEALAHTHAARAFQRRMNELAYSDETTELASLVDAGPIPSLTAFDKSALSIVLLLSKPSIRQILHAADSPKEPSAGQLRRLGSVLKRIQQNAAIRALIRQGRALKKDPERLRRAVRKFVRELRSGTLVEHPAEGGNDDLFAATGLALRSKMPVLGANSLAQAAERLLSAPEAPRYLASLSPLALASLEPAETATAPSARASDVVASSTNPNCPAAKSQILLDAMRGVAQSATQAVVEEGKKKAAVKVIKRYLPDYFKLARTLAGNPLTSILQALGWSALRASYPAVRNAALDCYATRIALVPQQETIQAGHWQAYKIAIYGESGDQRFGRWINDPDTMTIFPGDDPTDGAVCKRATPYWECFGNKKGPHQVRATLRDLEAEGVLVVEPGPPVAINVLPESATVGVSETSPSYEATGEDAYYNKTEVIVPGVATKDGVRAHLSMFPSDGPCSDLTARCTPESSGPHNIIIERDDGVRNHAHLEVLPNKLKLSPESAIISPGDSQSYSVEEVSAIGMKGLGPVTFGPGADQARLSIAPDGSCDQESGSCTASLPGLHTVTATAPHASGTATLDVKKEIVIDFDDPGAPEVAGALYTYYAAAVFEAIPPEAKIEPDEELGFGLWSSEHYPGGKALCKKEMYFSGGLKPWCLSGWHGVRFPMPVNDLTFGVVRTENYPEPIECKVTVLYEGDKGAVVQLSNTVTQPYITQTVDLRGFAKISRVEIRAGNGSIALDDFRFLVSE